MKQNGKSPIVDIDLYKIQERIKVDMKTHLANNKNLGKERLNAGELYSISTFDDNKLKLLLRDESKSDHFNKVVRSEIEKRKVNKDLNKNYWYLNDEEKIQKIKQFKDESDLLDWRQKTHGGYELENIRGRYLDILEQAPFKREELNEKISRQSKRVDDIMSALKPPTIADKIRKTDSNIEALQKALDEAKKNLAKMMAKQNNK